MDKHTIDIKGYEILEITKDPKVDVEITYDLNKVKVRIADVGD